MSKNFYLHKDDLKSILHFLESVNPESEMVEIIVDQSSGIGSIVVAKINNIDYNGHTVSVEKLIVDESSW